MKVFSLLTVLAAPASAAWTTADALLWTDTAAPGFPGCKPKTEQFATALLVNKCFKTPPVGFAMIIPGDINDAVAANGAVEQAVQFKIKSSKGTVESIYMTGYTQGLTSVAFVSASADTLVAAATPTALTFVVTPTLALSATSSDTLTITSDTAIWVTGKVPVCTLTGGVGAATATTTTTALTLTVTTDTVAATTYTIACATGDGAIAANAASVAAIKVQAVSTKDTLALTLAPAYTTGATVAFLGASADSLVASAIPTMLKFSVKPTTMLRKSMGDTLTITSDVAVWVDAKKPVCTFTGGNGAATALVSGAGTILTLTITVDTQAAKAYSIDCATGDGAIAANAASVTAVQFKVKSSKDTTETALAVGYTQAASLMTLTSVTPDARLGSAKPATMVFIVTPTKILVGGTDTLTFTSDQNVFASPYTPVCTITGAGGAGGAATAATTSATTLVLTFTTSTVANTAYTISCTDGDGAFAAAAPAATDVQFKAVSTKDVSSTAFAYQYTSGGVVAFVSASPDTLAADATPLSITFVATLTSALAIGDTITIVADRAVWVDAKVPTCTISGGGTAPTAATSVSGTTLVLTLTAALAGKTTYTVLCSGVDAIAVNPANAVGFKLTSTNDATAVAAFATGYTAGATLIALSAVTTNTRVKSAQPNRIAFTMKAPMALVAGDTITLTSDQAVWTNAKVPICSFSGDTIVAASVPTVTALTSGAGKILTLTVAKRVGAAASAVAHPTVANAVYTVSCSSKPVKLNLWLTFGQCVNQESPIFESGEQSPGACLSMNILGLISINAIVSDFGTVAKAIPRETFTSSDATCSGEREVEYLPDGVCLPSPTLSGSQRSTCSNDGTVLYEAFGESADCTGTPNPLGGSKTTETCHTLASDYLFQPCSATMPTPTAMPTRSPTVPPTSAAGRGVSEVGVKAGLVAVAVAAVGAAVAM